MSCSLSPNCTHRPLLPTQATREHLDTFISQYHPTSLPLPHHFFSSSHPTSTAIPHLPSPHSLHLIEAYHFFLSSSNHSSVQTTNAHHSPPPTPSSLGSTSTGALSSLPHVHSLSQLALQTSIDNTLTTFLETSISLSSTSSTTYRNSCPASPTPFRTPPPPRKPLPSHPPPTFTSSTPSTSISHPIPTFRGSSYSPNVHHTNRQTHHQIPPISTKSYHPHSIQMQLCPPSKQFLHPVQMSPDILLNKPNNSHTYARYHKSPFYPSFPLSTNSPRPSSSPHTKHILTTHVRASAHTSYSVSQSSITSHISAISAIYTVSHLSSQFFLPSLSISEEIHLVMSIIITKRHITGPKRHT
ncbi:unnamed protein product, partial [Rodentolepis nana]|uniref:Extensin-like n=1 Tax=Rodentolepis nana TaxID=102285 RepID=A0A0R3T668_RODNA